MSSGLVALTLFLLAGSASAESGQCPVGATSWRDVACCRPGCGKSWNPLPLLLISFDGFRADYLARNKTPSMKRISECGVHAPFMYPSYPSKTFPNHYSIVTGLYPESHGIIDNTMYDATIEPPEDRLFKRGQPSSYNPQWWKGEPFWNTVNKNGMRSATMFWPGADGRVQDMTPTYAVRFNKSMPLSERVGQVVNWLLLPDNERPDFITLYLDQVDADGHKYGPDSEQVNNALAIVDGQMDYLFSRLYQENLMHCINILFVADHGMQKVNEFIRLDQFVPNRMDSFNVFEGPVARIVVNKSTNLVPSELKEELECKDKRYRVYTKATIPKRLHYSRSPRIGDIILDAGAGVEIFKNQEKINKFLKKGDHGYDYRYHSVHAIFFAFGPSYKMNHTIPPFQNVELYNLMASTLGLQKTASTNGTPNALDDVFLVSKNTEAPTDATIAQCQFTSAQSESCGACDAQAPASCQHSTDNADIVGIHDLTAAGDQHCKATLCPGVSHVQDSQTKSLTAVFGFVTEADITERQPKSSCINSCTQSCSDISSNEAKLQNLNMTLSPLHVRSCPSGNFADLLTPMHKRFRQGIWQYMEDVTAQYVRRFQRLLVISGSIFDYNYDNVKDDNSVARQGSMSTYKLADSDMLIPTHYYRIFLRCTGTWQTSSSNSFDTPCQGGDLEEFAFVFPHKADLGNCMSPTDNYLALHSARIRDVELLTGLEFFRTWRDKHVSVGLRTRIRTFERDEKMLK